MNPKDLVIEGQVVNLVDGTYGKIAKLEGVEGVTVSCLLHQDDVAAVKKGDTVVLKGRCRGFFAKDKSVDFNGGRLVKDK